jgi:uncharacterized membrane protein
VKWLKIPGSPHQGSPHPPSPPTGGRVAEAFLRTSSMFIFARRALASIARLAGTSALVLVTSGCSFLFVTPPPSPPSRRECTTSRLAPVLDSIAAGYEIFRTGYAIAAPDEVYDRIGVPREADIAVGAGLSALFVGSAIYGYVNTAECERVEETRPIDDYGFP